LCSTYLITQFQALGTEVRTFTSGHISATTAVLVAAAILLVFDLLGGMRAVAYTDVLQGVVLLIGDHILGDPAHFIGRPASCSTVLQVRVWLWVLRGTLLGRVWSSSKGECSAGLNHTVSGRTRC
jgi:hypothetical protein